MTVIQKNGRSVAVIDRDTKLASTQDMLDLFVTVQYEKGCEALVVFKENLSDEFFDLKTRVAGELLQKCSNYHMRFAVVGDFSEYTSKSLRDFIYESNKGNLVCFSGTLDSAVETLTK